MKKVLILVTMISVFASCDLFNHNYSFNPPNWIKGEWSDRNSTNNYQFKDNNVILESSRISLDFQEAFKYRSINEPKRLSDEYVISVTEYGVNSFYHFIKTSENSLNYYVSTGGVTYGPLTLIRNS